MIIDSSKIGMESARRYTSVQYRATTYTARRGLGNEQSPDFGNLLDTDDTKMQKNSSDNTSDTEDAKTTDSWLEDTWKAMRSTNKIHQITPRSQAQALSRVRQQCLLFILKFLGGFQSRSMEEYSEQTTISEQALQQAKPIKLFRESKHQEFFYESEETSFSTTGHVKTADGRTIDFQMDIYMGREFSSYYEEASLQEAIQFMDPLVINLDSDIASVSDQKFYFDLDADGEMEQISRLGKNSGYLALDLNENGIIDDGSELFGTASGDGFLDLSKYDDDHNGWIDERDAIFSKLKIWAQDEQGNSELYQLKEKDIGALCLSRVSTNHSLNNLQDNTTNAAIRSTGIFLYENGTVGSMQQVDLARSV